MPIDSTLRSRPSAMSRGIAKYRRGSPVGAADFMRPSTLQTERDQRLRLERSPFRPGGQPPFCASPPRSTCNEHSWHRACDALVAPSAGRSHGVATTRRAPAIDLTLLRCAAEKCHTDPRRARPRGPDPPCARALARFSPKSAAGGDRGGHARRRRLPFYTATSVTTAAGRGPARSRRRIR